MISSESWNLPVTAPAAVKSRCGLPTCLPGWSGTLRRCATSKPPTPSPQGCVHVGVRGPPLRPLQASPTTRLPESFREALVDYMRGVLPSRIRPKAEGAPGSNPLFESLANVRQSGVGKRRIGSPRNRYCQLGAERVRWIFSNGLARRSAEHVSSLKLHSPNR